MTRIESSFFDIGAIDSVSEGNSPIHRMDPRAKLVTTLIFIVVVLSFGRYEVSALIPFFIYPVFLVGLGDLPIRYLLKKILLVSPFALLVAVFNPVFDKEVLVYLGPVGITGGWVSFASIMLRFVLTVGVALILIVSTGFHRVCVALEKMGAPRIFVVQLLFLYRYIFVLVEEASRMAKARTLRAFHGRGMGIGTFTSLVGNLLLRTLERAHRIHMAMLCRGFNGEIRIIRPLKIGPFEILFVLGWSASFLFMRLYDIPTLVGSLVMGSFL